MCNIKECMYKIQSITDKWYDKSNSDYKFVTSLINYYGSHQGQLTEKQTTSIKILYKKYLDQMINAEVESFIFPSVVENQNINELHKKLNLKKDALKNAFTDKNNYLILAKILKKINNDRLTESFFCDRIAGEYQNMFGLIQPLAQEYNIKPVEITNKYLKP